MGKTRKKIIENRLHTSKPKLTICQKIFFSYLNFANLMNDDSIKKQMSKQILVIDNLFVAIGI